jgi:hypothetical protein
MRGVVLRLGRQTDFTHIVSLRYGLRVQAWLVMHNRLERSDVSLPSTVAWTSHSNSSRLHKLVLEKPSTRHIIRIRYKTDNSLDLMTYALSVNQPWLESIPTAFTFHPPSR